MHGMLHGLQYMDVCGLPAGLGAGVGCAVAQPAIAMSRANRTLMSSPLENAAPNTPARH
jgi:hypothetical protein